MGAQGADPSLYDPSLYGPSFLEDAARPHLFPCPVFSDRPVMPAPVTPLRPPLDRRTLLKTAAAAGAAALAPPAALSSDASNASDALRWDEEHDVVIAGAGGAGLAAAVMAGGICGDVVVLEKMQSVGGNTRLADAFNAVDPSAQQPLGIEDSPELHASQMIETGRWCANPALAQTVAYGAPKTLEWLKEIGVKFEPGVYQVYGSLWARTHSPSEPEGSGYIRPLLFKCRELGVSIRTGTKVRRVIRDGLEGPVRGVEAL